MTKIKMKSTKILAIAATILVIALMTLFFMALGDDVNADSVEGGEILPGEDTALDETVEPTEESGNWFRDNWKTIVEILTSGTTLAVVVAIIKFIGKIAKLRNDLGITNTDNKALKNAFNDMADELESLAKRLEDLHTQNTSLMNSVSDSGNKSAAVLSILERLISSSDLPTETKVALQGVINKADGAEDITNDEE